MTRPRFRANIRGMSHDLDAEILGLTRQIEAGRMAADRIEDNRAARARLEPLDTDQQRLRARRRGYDAVKRAKIERERVATLIAWRAQLIAQRDADAVAAALASL